MTERSHRNSCSEAVSERTGPIDSHCDAVELVESEHHRLSSEAARSNCYEPRVPDTHLRRRLRVRGPRHQAETHGHCRRGTGGGSAMCTCYYSAEFE